MKKEHLSSLLNRYLTGELNANDERILFQYLADPINLEEAKAIMEADWEEGDFDTKMADGAADAVFNTILAHKETVRIRSNKGWMIAAAAAILIIISISYLWQRTIIPQIEAPKIVQTKVGNEHEKVVLPDGSEVVLNNHSTLSYPEKFNQSTREVTLNGEGYFDIKHDANKPFIVHAGKLSTRVLGTAFNISTSGRENKIVVTVTRGKVSVSNGQKVLGTLTPGQQIQYDLVINRPVLTKVNSEKVVSWQASDIFFKDATIVEIMDVLAKRFDRKITFSDTTGQKCRLTATFLNGESFEEVLKVIAQFNGLTYKITDAGVVINTKSCNQ